MANLPVGTPGCKTTAITKKNVTKKFLSAGWKRWRSWKPSVPAEKLGNLCYTNFLRPFSELSCSDLDPGSFCGSFPFGWWWLPCFRPWKNVPLAKFIFPKKMLSRFFVKFSLVFFKGGNFHTRFSATRFFCWNLTTTRCSPPFLRPVESSGEVQRFGQSAGWRGANQDDLLMEATQLSNEKDLVGWVI